MAESSLAAVFQAALEGQNDTIKNWLAHGGDPNQALDRVFSDEGVAYEPGSTLVNRYAEAADILEGVRLAGHSYKRWVLKDYMALLRLRSLVARRRARAGPETPEAVARLFDGVPDPCFWLVVEYAWLGNWRRP